MGTVGDRIIDYWTERSHTYSESVKDSLYNKKGEDLWRSIFYSFVDQNKKLKFLDIGTGPGMFTAILGKNFNFKVTAIDSSPGMIDQARENTEKAGAKADFILSHAQKLPFESETYDVIVTRNVTWNLQQPEKAYTEWLRVLKKGGKIINFDANWYLRLFDQEMKKEYDEVKKLEKIENVPDGMRERMEDIARQLPLSRIRRPLWDVEFFLKNQCKDIFINPNLNEDIYTEEEKNLYRMTPMFLIVVTK